MTPGVPHALLGAIVAAEREMAGLVMGSELPAAGKAYLLRIITGARDNLPAEKLFPEMTPTTLFSRATRAGLPPARAMLDATRLVYVAAAVAEVPDAGPIAYVLSYSGGPALRRMVRRTQGIAWTTFVGEQRAEQRVHGGEWLAREVAFWATFDVLLYSPDWHRFTPPTSGARRQETT